MTLEAPSVDAAATSGGERSESAPRVSIVVIFWNAGAFLRDAIESVEVQSYPDWELLLVDDGSMDGAGGLVQEVVARRPGQVRYLEHPGHANRGMSASRNLGIREARGEYVAFLDADDAWEPETLADQVALLDARPHVAMVYGPIRYWFSWTGRPEDAGRDHIEALGVPADAAIPPPRLVPLFLRDRAAVPSGILVRRTVAVRMGGFEDEFRGEYEDQVFCAKVCLVEPVYAAGRSWYRYRQHPESTVAVGLRTGATDAARLRFLEWLDGYLVTTRVTAPSVWLALRIELWRFRRPRLFHLARHAERLAGRLRGRRRRRAPETGPPARGGR